MCEKVMKNGKWTGVLRTYPTDAAPITKSVRAARPPADVYQRCDAALELCRRKLKALGAEDLPSEDVSEHLRQMLPQLADQLRQWAANELLNHRERFDQLVAEVEGLAAFGDHEPGQQNQRFAEDEDAELTPEERRQERTLAALVERLEENEQRLTRALRRA